MPLVHFETFGCQMNVADSDLVADALARRGFAVTNDRDAADLLVVNTCSVRAHAETRARARLRELAAARRASPRHPGLWVIGCMAERLGDRLREEIPGIDAVIGATRVEFIDRFVDDYLKSARRVNDAAGAPASSRVSAFVPVMRGCDNFCAYCIVPHVRGREHSVPAGDVEAQVRGLVEAGVREVTLLGQNVNSYRSDGVDFPDLLARLNGVQELSRIRFTTSHPKDCSERLIRTVAELPRLCKHLHLPVQSGSTRMLLAMNRRYTRDDYLRLAEAIRRAMPDADLTTDVMTGFPAETERDFEDTLSLLREVRFTAAFMFAYSPRPGTAAEGMPDDVPRDVKTERLNRIIELQTKITKERYAAMIGREVEVLVEGRNGKRRDQWMGQDRGCKRVALTCPGDLSGMILRARVMSTTGMTLVCEKGREIHHQAAKSAKNRQGMRVRGWWERTGMGR